MADDLETLIAAPMSSLPSARKTAVTSMARLRSEKAHRGSVAEHAGVSRRTVSNAINAPERLRPETLARVRASIEAFGYRIEPTPEDVSCPVLDRFVHALTATAANTDRRGCLPRTVFA